MSFRFESHDEDEEESTKEKQTITEQKKQENEQSTELTEQQIKTEEDKAELIRLQVELEQRRREHKKVLNTIRAQTFRLYFRVLKSFPNKSFTATELWVILRQFFTNKLSKYRTTDQYIITEEEFYGIFGHYPMTMANNRLYKVTFLLKQHPDIEWLRDGRVIRYRYIGTKKNGTK